MGLLFSCSCLTTDHWTRRCFQVLEENGGESKLMLFVFLSFRLWCGLVKSRECKEDSERECTRRETGAQCTRRVGEESVVVLILLRCLKERKGYSHGAEENTDHQDHGWEEQAGEWNNTRLSYIYTAWKEVLFMETVHAYLWKQVLNIV